MLHQPTSYTVAFFKTSVFIIEQKIRLLTVRKGISCLIITLPPNAIAKKLNVDYNTLILYITDGLQNALTSRYLFTFYGIFYHWTPISWHFVPYIAIDAYRLDTCCVMGCLFAVTIQHRQKNS